VFVLKAGKGVPPKPSAVSMFQRGVRLVRRHLGDVEVLGRPLHERDEKVEVVDGVAASLLQVLDL
jgi:hypothetical protein